jgi:hypothetical protein
MRELYVPRDSRVSDLAARADTGTASTAIAAVNNMILFRFTIEDALLDVRVAPVVPPQGSCSALAWPRCVHRHAGRRALRIACVCDGHGNMTMPEPLAGTDAG